MKRWIRYAVADVVAFVVLLPLMAVSAAIGIGAGAARFLEWASVDRAWSGAILNFADRIIEWGERR